MSFISPDFAVKSTLFSPILAKGLFAQIAEKALITEKQVFFLHYPMSGTLTYTYFSFSSFSFLYEEKSACNCLRAWLVSSNFLLDSGLFTAVTLGLLDGVPILNDVGIYQI